MISRDELDDIVEGYFENKLFAGSCLVGCGDEILIHRHHGQADVSTGRSIEDSTRFLIASVTKPFTACAALILRDRGGISLDDRIMHFLPQLSEKYRQVTIRDLLQHTSGLPEYTEFPGFAAVEADGSVSMEVVLDLIDHSATEIGSSMSYSYANTNYFLLGEILQSVSGFSYQEFVIAEILRPLGMKFTGFVWDSLPAGDKALGHDNGERCARTINPALVTASMGMHATVRDIWVWLQALKFNRLLSEKSVAEMLAAGEHGYGLGWHVRDLLGHRAVSHGGNCTGYTSFVAWFPDDDFFTAVLCNDRRSGANQLSFEVVKSIFR